VPHSRKNGSNGKLNGGVGQANGSSSEANVSPQFPAPSLTFGRKSELRGLHFAFLKNRENASPSVAENWSARKKDGVAALSERKKRKENRDL
jgi:hypothetical protein